MKGKIILLVVLLPLFASAQNKETIDSLAKNKLMSLTDSWSLGISDSADMDIEVYNKFKMLFDSSATIQDDLNVFYRYTGFKKPGIYKAGGKSEPFDIYAHDVALAVLITNLLLDTSSIASVDSKDPATRIYRLKRSVEFQKTGKYVVPDTYDDTVIKSRSIEPKKDSLRRDLLLQAGIKKIEDSVYKFTTNQELIVTMVLDRNSNDMVITDITTVSNELKCVNDEDYDGIVDNQDSLPQTPGDFTANGKPDYDLDGVADADDKCVTTYGVAINKGCPIEYFYTRSLFDVFVGLQYNLAKINLPDLNQLGYLDKTGNAATDVLQSKKGTLKSSGQIGIHAGGNFIYYFGKGERKTGISLGFNYTGFNTTYTMDMSDPMVYVFKSNDGTDDYRRQIRFDSLVEDIHYNVFNLPVMLNYRWHPGKKNNSVIKLQAGPSLMLFRNTSNYTAKIDFGGMYQIDTTSNGRNAITYYNYFNDTSIYNVYFTADKLNTPSDPNAANNVFQQLRKSGNYDFADDKYYSGYEHLKSRLTVAFNVGLDLQQKISEGLTLKAGADFVYAPLFERSKKYVPIDKTTDSFQSIYNSNSKSYYTAFGVNIGLVYNW